MGRAILLPLNGSVRCVDKSRNFMPQMNSIFALKLWFVFGLIGFSVLIGGTCVSFFSNLNVADLYCESVTGVVSSDNTVYAMTIDREINYRRYESNDGGFTWQTTKNIPTSVNEKLSSPVYDKFQPVCHPNIEHLCYRISASNGAEEVAPEFPTKLEKSVDNGETWQEVILPFRVKPQLGCTDSYPRSLTFIESAELENDYNLIVAVNSGGVLVHSPNGEWVQNNLEKMKGRQ